jgi:hypothetical protein
MTGGESPEPPPPQCGPRARRLPVVRWRGVDYFVDDRLAEFRPVGKPYERTEFDSTEGRRMLVALSIVTRHR